MYCLFLVQYFGFSIGYQTIHYLMAIKMNIYMLEMLMICLVLWLILIFGTSVGICTRAIGRGVLCCSMVVLYLFGISYISLLYTNLLYIGIIGISCFLLRHRTPAGLFFALILATPSILGQLSDMNQILQILLGSLWGVLPYSALKIYFKGTGFFYGVFLWDVAS